MQPLLRTRLLPSLVRNARAYARPAFLAPELTVDQLVIGGGVVGLAIGEKLVQAYPERSTFVVERHKLVGQETSSRNSEVIHAGIYYDLDRSPLKTSLCIAGRDMLYARCRERSIAHQNCGKLIIATSKDQTAYLQKMVKKADEIKRRGLGEVPLRWVSGAELRELEPDVAHDAEGALLSTSTGIVSSHAFMDDLEKSILDSEQGEVVLGTKVTRIDPAQGGEESGWVVQMDNDGERSAVLARVVINAAGLNAHHILNQVVPSEQRLRQFFAKGSYFSYRGPGASTVRHLLYPCPDQFSLAGLGTHLTFDMDGNLRFGPDVKWLEAPLEEGVDVADFWEAQLAADEEGLAEAIKAVQKYLPNVDPEGFAPDYSGIRPKLTGPGEPAADFSITHPLKGFISLNGIESPGLTSSLAIAERVHAIVEQL